MKLPNNTLYRYDVIAENETEAIKRAKNITNNEFVKILSNSTKLKLINK